MQKKNRISDLIPADDLYWDDEEKKHVVISKKEEDDLFRACLRCGLGEDETFQVFKHYQHYKTSEILFKHFLKGNIGIYSFRNDHPVFEKPRETDQTVELLFFKDKGYFFPDSIDGDIVANAIDFKDGFLGCSYPKEVFPFDKIFETVLNWCSNRGFTLFDGESPDDEESLTLKGISEDDIDGYESRTWKINKLFVKKDCYLYAEVTLGSWFEFEKGGDNDQSC